MVAFHRVKALGCAALLVLCVAVGWTSCRTAPSVGPEAVLRLDTVRIDTLCPLFPDREGPKAHLTLEWLLPAQMADPARLELVRSYVASPLRAAGLFGPLTGQGGSVLDRAGGDAQRAAALYVEDYMSLYREDVSEALTNYDDADLTEVPWLNYEARVELVPLYDGAGLLCYALTAYSYTGGAHGMTGRTYCAIDLAALNALGLADVFQPERMDEVNGLLRIQLMADYKCSTLDELAAYFFDPAAIEATDNFYVDNQGIHWSYDPYEIAPYATGLVSVGLPWDAVGGYLLSDSPVRVLFRAQ